MTDTAHHEAAITVAVEKLSELFQYFALPVKKAPTPAANVVPFGRPVKKPEPQQPLSPSLRVAHAVANARDIIIPALNGFGKRDEAGAIQITMDNLSAALTNNDLMQIYEGLGNLTQQTQALLDASHYLQNAISQAEAAGKVHKLYRDVAIMGGQSPWPRENGEEGITPSPLNF